MSLRHDSVVVSTPIPDFLKAVEVPTSSFYQDLQAQALAYRRVCVVGLGYVGLPTALLFAQNGFNVQGVDISSCVLSMISSNKVGGAYPELADWWKAVGENGQFRASSKPEPADVFLITTPTPVHPDSKSCDLSMVRAAIESLLPVLQPGNLIILESTVPPGTTRRILKPLLEAGTGLSVEPGPDQSLYLCFSPERVLPGNTKEELLNNDRVVGGYGAAASFMGQTFLQRVLKGCIDVTDDITAEFCKLAENTYRDVNIALANELSILADEYGITMSKARELINRHPRVNLLKAGIGVGGHCIAVDPWFFVEASPENTQLIATSRRVNDRMPQYTAERILQEVASLGIVKPKLVLAGLAYKPGVCDTRESPAIRIVEALQAAGADVVAYDPLLAEHQDKTLTTMAKGADYLAILVPHGVLKEDLHTNRSAIENAMRTPRIREF
jgi:UDP-N-acetyl-D-mannosaminuronic acid dehydrogenase